MPLTFRTSRKRARHFQDHGSDFGALNEADYESKAGAFLTNPLNTNTLEGIRPRDNATIRYNTVTEEYGIISSDGYIRTYYKPDPTLHGLPSNLDYFNDNCNQV